MRLEAEEVLALPEIAGALADAPEVKPTEGAAPPAKRRVLVVDDSPILVEATPRQSQGRSDAATLVRGNSRSRLI